jgi:hypothetical protein
LKTVSSTKALAFTLQTEVIEKELKIAGEIDKRIEKVMRRGLTRVLKSCTALEKLRRFRLRRQFAGETQAN